VRSMLMVDSEGLWVKAALHCHSRASDGSLEPEKVVEYYSSRGYRVISLTDHSKITLVGENGDWLTIPGVEASKGRGVLGASYHLVALGVRDQELLAIGDPQEFIDAVNEAGGLVFIAHPYWSSLVHEDLTSLNGYIGIEVYNTGCDVEVAKGYSTTHWDNLLSAGLRRWGLAVDDAHRYTAPPLDSDGGWVWLRLDGLDENSVLKALRDGRFYSSTGPRILRLELNASGVSLESTPVSRINLVSYNGRGFCVSLKMLRNLVEAWRSLEGRSRLERVVDSVEIVEEEGREEVFVKAGRIKAMAKRVPEGLVGFRIEAELGSRYVRVEVVDRDGGVAWSNPFFPET